MRLALALLLCVACAAEPSEIIDDPSAQVCVDINAADGELVCLDRVQSTSDFARVSGRAGAGPRVSKFVVPGPGDEALRAAAFMNTRRFPLHLDFVRAAFPDRYGAATTADYPALFLEGGRPFIAGLVAEGEGGAFTFSIVEDGSVGASHVTRATAIRVWSYLAPRFTIGALAFAPTGDRQRDAAQRWSDLPFLIDGVDTDYQAYNVGRSCGFIRRVRLDELEARVEAGALSFRDIVVLDGAPADIEPVVSGIVTAEPQGPLSHLAVRSAARGTPNVYVRDQSPFDAFVDALACIDVTREGFSIAATDLPSAEAFWASLRPQPVELAEPDRNREAIPSLRAIDLSSAALRADAVRAYGAKGTNLALLYQLIDRHDGYRGVLLPASLYERFLQEATWRVDLGEGEGEHTFAETLDRWLADDALLADPVRVRARFEALREAMRDATVPADVVQRVYDAIVAEYGNDQTLVRFRSSSNAEDALGFSGAGLYDSTSVCPADTRGARGESRCGAHGRERSIERGLLRVWSSLWRVSAFEERAWHGMDQRRVIMSILVNDRAGDEQANVVAFSGNPLGDASDRRLLLTAQVGDVDLVSPVPGTRPESLLLAREGANIGAIDRIAQSTETRDEVLSDADARAIGTLLLQLEQSFPIDEAVPEGRTVLLDTEWKVLEDGSLVIKQIRPFLR